VRFLTDAELEQIEPLSGGDSLDVCPTCRGKGEYPLDGEVHPCDCANQIMLRKHYLLAGIGDQYQRTNWETDYMGPTEIRDSVIGYARKFDQFRPQGLGLLFQGTVGTGKTLGATYVAKEVVKQGGNVFFQSFFSLIGVYQRESQETERKRVREATLLVIDELQPPRTPAQKNFFPWEFEALIRHRTDFNLPTIITTNMNEGEFSAAYSYGYSLLDPKTLSIQTNGNDYRKQGELSRRNLERSQNGEVAPIT